MRYELKHLSTFVAVAEELNFHRAAERLMMAQPAVSRIIVELETRLGVKLLERTTRSVRLTESGRYLLQEAQGILSRIEIVEDHVRHFAKGIRTILRIGYTTITGHSLLPTIAQEFRRTNPEVRLDLTYLTSPQQRHRILQGEIDFGFVEGSFQSPEISTRVVARHGLVVLMKSDHILGKNDVLSIDDIYQEPLVMGTRDEWPTFRRIVSDAFRSADRVLSVAQEASSLTGLLGLVTAGVGMTIFCGLPSFCVDGTIVARRLTTSPPITVETHLAWRRTDMSGTMHRFVETAQRVADNYIRPGP
jgi:DNA-binding transcriptional LysR family regulator